MGLLITCIIAIVIGIFILIGLSYGIIRGNDIIIGVALILVIMSTILLILSGVAALSVESDRAAKYAEFESIIMYNTVVEESNDMELKWRHQGRVDEWNENMRNYEKSRDNWFFGLMFCPNIYKDCQIIETQFYSSDILY